MSPGQPGPHSETLPQMQHRPAMSVPSHWGTAASTGPPDTRGHPAGPCSSGLQSRGSGRLHRCSLAGAQGLGSSPGPIEPESNHKDEGGWPRAPLSPALTREAEAGGSGIKMHGRARGSGQSCGPGPGGVCAPGLLGPHTHTHTRTHTGIRIPPSWHGDAVCECSGQPGARPLCRPQAGQLPAASPAAAYLLQRRCGCRPASQKCQPVTGQ